MAKSECSKFLLRQDYQHLLSWRHVPEIGKWPVIFFTNSRGTILQSYVTLYVRYRFCDLFIDNISTMTCYFSVSCRYDVSGLYGRRWWFAPWWRHQMENFPRHWPFVRGIHRSPVNSTHKSQWRGALMFFYLRLNKRLSKQSWGWWFKTPSSSLWRHCNAEMTGKLFLMEGYLTRGANETVDPPYVLLKLLNGNNTRLLWICLINTFFLRNVYLCNSVMSCAISCFDWYMHIQRISLSNHNILTSGRIWHTSDTNQTFRCIIMPICDLT